jgi:hypothetical protein
VSIIKDGCLLFFHHPTPPQTILFLFGIKRSKEKKEKFSQKTVSQKKKYLPQKN